MFKILIMRQIFRTRKALHFIEIWDLHSILELVGPVLVCLSLWQHPFHFGKGGLFAWLHLLFKIYFKERFCYTFPNIFHRKFWKCNRVLLSVCFIYQVQRWNKSHLNSKISLKCKPQGTTAVPFHFTWKCLPAVSFVPFWHTFQTIGSNCQFSAKREKCLHAETCNFVRKCRWNYL